MNEEQLQELLQELACVLTEPAPPGLCDRIRDEIRGMIVQERQTPKHGRPDDARPAAGTGLVSNEHDPDTRQTEDAVREGEFWSYEDTRAADFGREPPGSCGVSQMRDVVVFTAFYPRAKRVLLAGDFNSWNPEATPMRRLGESGIWQARIRLRQGVHEYRFIVDGEWRDDPYNKLKRENPYKGCNSVIEVRSCAMDLAGVGSPQMASAAV